MIKVTSEGFRSMRQEMGHTQAQIALWFGVSPLCVLRWENKKTALPGAAKILMHLLYEEHRGNENALHDYVKGILGSQQADAILRVHTEALHDVSPATNGEQT